MKAHTKETQATMTPAKALEFLKQGNERFQNNLKANRNLLEQVNDTSEGQWPFAVILSCIDSRVSAELVFDQGLGDIFSVRIAGNFVNEDILGSMEFACKIAGSKLVVVLGHSKCGAIKGVCDNVTMGNLTALMSKLKPAVEAVKEPSENRNSGNADFVDNVAQMNVRMTIGNIKSRSTILNDMFSKGEIGIVGGMYDVETGVVRFFED
ncbi:carbonic anhydrase family protein [Imperialibacter roseus]|uniref:Carbonic anhydrase family protein n=1 Tax=Imperialibacter roseus TaxID=1324217 RepID=A0ABZ0J0P2_9BACT|nr:carbonic anhydrase family protein [Imperialibacter roseus]WOK09730.1 carbonic anhydrase family protein [Imperialibacter roseus]